ncbi:MAG: hypothetical protein LQ352_005915, partial [Teloschistes flavicans]
MADIETPKLPIDSLESTLAVVFKETGKYFRAAQSQDARQIGIAKAAIAQLIPATNLKFHEALDEIEIEILRAKAVFDRDLSSIRKKRAERERAAAGILKAQSPKVITKGATSRGSPKEDVKSNLLSTSNEGTGAAVADDTLDISMIDQSPNQDQPPDQPNPSSADAIKTEPFALPQEVSQDPDQPKGLAISLPEDPSASGAKPDPENTDATSGQLPKEETSTPNENSLQDAADFDSMFNDPNDPTEDLDLALAFPTDDAPTTTTTNNDNLTANNDNTTDLLNASAFENISIPAPTNTTITDPQTQNPNNQNNDNEDLSSLLPGLENYVNGTPNGFDVSIAEIVSSIPHADDFDPQAKRSLAMEAGNGDGAGAF